MQENRRIGIGKNWLAITLSGLVILMAGCATIGNMKESNLDRKARQIHQRVLTIDTHCDTPMHLSRPEFNIGERHEADASGGRVDLVRMKEGGLDAMFFAVFIWQGERTPEGNEKAKASTLRILNAIRSAVASNINLAEIAYTPDEINETVRKDKRAILIGLENGYGIGNDLSLIGKYYDLGIRYITLCHTKNNDICDSANDSTEHGGLSKFGREVVREMNRVGMLIDVSHISDSAFYDVLALSRTPVFASHSCARAICDHPRNLSDDMLKAIAQKGGVIQINLYTGYVKSGMENAEREAALKIYWEKYPDLDQLSLEERTNAYRERDTIEMRYPQQLATVSDLADHIDHVVKLIGIDYVGIGSDFDGGGALQDCRDASQMENITRELVRRGYSEDDIAKIWGGNFLRVWRAVNSFKDSGQKNR